MNSELDPKMNLDPRKEDNKLKPKNSPTVAWIMMALAVLYTISPIDLLPDVIPVLGWVDDLFGIGAAGMNLMQAYSYDKSSTMYRIFKYLKWTMVIAGIIAILIIALAVLGITKLIQSL